MGLSRARLTLGLVALIVSASSVMLAIGGGDHAVGGAASTPAAAGVTAGPTQIVVQTLDSCRNGMDGAVYELLDGRGGVVATAGARSTSNHPTALAGGTCVTQQGDCVTTREGCTVFAAVPPGDYRLRATWTPAASTTAPGGYAPCDGGSACHWQTADVTVTTDGIVGQVTTIAPPGQVRHLPDDPAHATYFSGTPADPIVFHEAGLCKPGACPAAPVPPATTGTPNGCDGDGDADDWTTGAQSGDCALQPEAAEPTTCTPTMFTQSTSWNGVCFPWQIETNPVAAPQHLQRVVLSSATSSVTALSTFQVDVTAGTTPTLVSAQDRGMQVTRNATGFRVGLDPLRTPGGQVVSGSVTISPLGGQGSSLVITVAPPTANANFIENLYHDVLGRYGAPEEVTYWAGRMDGGMLGWQMAQVFSVTPEYLGRMVDVDYQSMVGAAPAPGDPGRAYWVSQLAAGRSNDVIVGSLGASPAYYAQAGGTDDGYITSLYSRVLHRSGGPSAQDLQHWRALGPFADDQAARLQVANDFSFSHEQHAYVVGTWYTTFLGRGPDAPGQAFWAGQLDRGVLQQVGVSSFTNTPEYFDHPAKY